MAISIQFPNSKKNKDGYYPSTQREQVDTVHYPNHSVTIKKHDCIFNSKGNRCNVDCNAFRPVTRRNITDMPNSQTCDPFCDNVTKPLCKFAAKNCPNLKTHILCGTQIAPANYDQEYSDVKYDDTPCIVNDMRKSKPKYGSTRRTNRGKFAFKEHVNRMHSTKQRYVADCEEIITYCDGSTETEQCPKIQQNRKIYPDLYKPSYPYSPAIATRSFGTGTYCKALCYKKPPCSIGTNTSNKESLYNGPLAMPKQQPFILQSPWRKQDYNTSDREGCVPTTCPIQTVLNLKKQTNSIPTENTSAQQVMASEIQSIPTQTVKEDVMINDTSSQAKETDQCPILYQRQCTKETDCKMFQTGDKYCKVLDMETTLEEMQLKCQCTPRQTEDVITPITTIDEKETPNTKTVDYGPYSYILNDSNETIRSHKKTNLTEGNDENGPSTLEQNNKNNPKMQVANMKKQPDVNSSNKKSPSDSFDSAISDSTSRSSPERSNSVLNKDEIARGYKSQNVKRKLNKKANSDELAPEQLDELKNLSANHPNLPTLLRDLVEQFNREEKRVSEDPQDKVSDGPQQGNQRELNRSNKTEADTQNIKLFNDTELAAVISAYIDKISPKMKLTEYMAHTAFPDGFHASDLNRIVRMLYDKIKGPSRSTIENSLQVSVSSTGQGRLYPRSATNEETLKIAKKLEAIKDGTISDITKTRILMKQSGGRTNKKVCTKRKALKHAFRNLDDRVSESLLKFSTENTGNVEEHEYLQFCLRITEDIIRNDLYTNGQMRRVFKSHLEANRGRLNTQRMVNEISSLCTELNIPFEATFPFENIIPTSTCDKQMDQNHVCYCEKEDGKLIAKHFCMCNFDYQKHLMNENESNSNKNIEPCQCGMQHCVEYKCPGKVDLHTFTQEEFDYTADKDFDFANEGILRTVVYSEPKCFGPKNKEGKCNCVIQERVSNTIRPTSAGATGYIPSISENDSPTRRPFQRVKVNVERKNGNNNEQYTTNVRLRDMNNRKDGDLAAPNLQPATNEDSAPVRIKTPVTALRTQYENAKTGANFLEVECPVLVPTGDIIGINPATKPVEVQNRTGGEVDVTKQPEKSIGSKVIAQLKEDANQMVHKNELNETQTPSMAVPTCNNCRCNAECSEINGELINDLVYAEEDERKAMPQINRNNNIIDKTIDNELQNVAQRKQNDLSEAFAKSGLKNRLEELTAVTLAISNNNMQSMLEKHPTYKEFGSSALGQINNNLTKPDESANVFYPSKALDTVYSKCLFQQNNLLLGDEYVMFNPYSVRPETILHFFPTACTQVASHDFIQESKSSVSSGVSSVTGIVENIIKASKDSSTNGSVKKLSLVPPENLVKAIKNEIDKAAEKKEPSSEFFEDGSTLIEIGAGATSSSSKSSKNSQQSFRNRKTSSSNRDEKDLKLPLVEEENGEVIGSHSIIDEGKNQAQIQKILDQSEENKPSYSNIDPLTRPESSISGKIENTTNQNSDIVTRDSIYNIGKNNEQPRSVINIIRSESNISAIMDNKWMEKLDHVPSIKMTPSLKGSFDKALSDTDKFRGIRNSNDDSPLIKGAMKQGRNDDLSVDASNISEMKKSTKGHSNSKRDSDQSERSTYNSAPSSTNGYSYKDV